MEPNIDALAETNEQVNEPMVKNFRLVEPGLALSAAPASAEEIDWLNSQGVRLIVSLHPVPDVVVKRIRELGIEWRPLLMEDFVGGPPSGFRETLDEVRKRTTEEPVALIHCSGGGGRAGTVYAAYRIRGGEDPATVIADTPGVSRDDQISFLRGWAAGVGA
jgi:hypothetical protein